MEENRNNENQDEEKGILDKIQDKFYEKRTTFDNLIFKLFIATVALMFLTLLVGSQFNHLFLYLGLPFSFSFLVTAILATTYFLAALYFRKRSIEKFLEKPKTTKEKFFKFAYTTLNFVIGFGFVWTLLGDSILTMIFGETVRSATERYNLTAIKLFSYCVFLILLYSTIVFSSFTSQMIGLGDKISRSDSIFNLASKRSFVMFLGGFFVCFGLLLTSTILDSKILTAVNTATEKMVQAKKDYQRFE